jgi:hypothetical protein
MVAGSAVGLAVHARVVTIPPAAFRLLASQFVQQASHPRNLSFVAAGGHVVTVARHLQFSKWFGFVHQ